MTGLVFKADRHATFIQLYDKYFLTSLHKSSSRFTLQDKLQKVLIFLAGGWGGGGGGERGGACWEQKNSNAFCVLFFYKFNISLTNKVISLNNRTQLINLIITFPVILRL